LLLKQWCVDRLETMQVFVAVARLGSFAAAARQLRLSASVATRAVAQLEDTLGLTLLARTTRSVRLTERGEVYFHSCQQILADIEDATRLARGENAAPRGELTVAAPVLFGRLHVLPVVTRLVRDHPALSVRLTLSDRNIHLVDEGVDVAVRIGALADSSLIAVRLGAVSRMVVGSSEYLASHGIPDAPADLTAHAIIAFDGIGASNEWRFGDGTITVRVAPRLTVNSADAAIAAAREGIGLTRTLSYQVRDEITAGRLVAVLQDFAGAALPVSVLYPAGRVASPNVAAFVATARAHFAAHPVVPADGW
jgi:DNA-binding transcriptional LysR family regulator